MSKKNTLKEIENAIYGENGLYSRIVYKIDEIGTKEAMKLTNKKRQYIDLFKRQFKNSNNFDYRPKFDTLKEIAKNIGVE